VIGDPVPLECVMLPQDEPTRTYTIYQVVDGELLRCSLGHGFLHSLPETWFEFAPYIAARVFEERGCEFDQPLIVYWLKRGGRELLRSTIGEAAVVALPAWIVGKVESVRYAN
jgi:hypothetical protein